MPGQALCSRFIFRFLLFFRTVEPALIVTLCGLLKPLGYLSRQYGNDAIESPNNQPISCIIRFLFEPLHKNHIDMRFELITENERLWAVRYDDCLDNVLDSILGQWNDVVWLRSIA